MVQELGPGHTDRPCCWVVVGVALVRRNRIMLKYKGCVHAAVCARTSVCPVLDIILTIA